jgi:hypothetical protein
VLCTVVSFVFICFQEEENGKELHQLGLRLTNSVGMLAEQGTDDLVRQDDYQPDTVMQQHLYFSINVIVYNYRPRHNHDLAVSTYSAVSICLSLTRW